MGLRSPSISTAAILLYQEAARFLLMLSTRFTGSRSFVLSRSEAGSMQILAEESQNKSINTHECDQPVQAVLKICLF